MTKTAFIPQHTLVLIDRSCLRRASRTLTRVNHIMTSPSSIPSRSIPILLLKTRSQPDDTYEELFSRSSTSVHNTEEVSFSPCFIPVLEHHQNEQTLSRLGEMLRTGDLKRKYGGMIFTSQRAVEAWADIVHKVEAETEPIHSNARLLRKDGDAFADLESLTPFPLYVVGPATEKALQTLSNELSRNFGSAYRQLNVSIHGADSGNGAKLAEFMLSHYNRLHEQHWFTYYEAPRLPFIPLLGMSSQNYGRKRLEKDDPRLEKRPLLFLVGEVRRDIIPKTLMGQSDSKTRIEVEEVEVYRTEVMNGFGEEFSRTCKGLDQQKATGLRVVVVFSPQGSDVMLQAMGYLDNQGEATERAKRRWWQGESVKENQTRWVIVTIGPTTRDYLKDKLGIEPDVCAAKPSPEGLKEAIDGFLQENKIEI